MRLRTFFATTLALCVAAGAATAAPILLPDGRSIEPAGFTVPVEGFASAAVLAPDGKWLAVLAQDGGAVDLISTSRSVLRERLAIPSATGIAWTSDGLYVTRGYTGTIARYAYDAAGSKDAPVLAKLIDLSAGPGLLNGVAEDPATHRLAVARSANREVLVLDSESGALLARHAASGQPFRVGFLGSTVIATLYDSDHVDAWTADTGDARRIATGPHPTELLIDGTRAYVANADGHDVVAIDGASLTVAQRYELALAPSAPPGQTPAGMAIASDRTTLYVAESGFNDVAVVDLATGRVRARIPTAWYPAALAFVDRATVGKKDARAKPQLWIASAQGLGAQPDPGGEWDGTYTGLVQHIVVEPARFAAWTAQVARNDRFARGEPVRAGLPPIEHVVFVVRENKHFDESSVTNAPPRAIPRCCSTAAR
jgi:YVTN family beta-propeller protein